MNQRLTEYNLNKDELEQLIDKYITTIVDSMSMEDFQQYVRNDMWIISVIVHLVVYLMR